jgi:thioredoxin-dependent peroxiredoxin
MSELKQGDKSPNFSGNDQNGEKITFSDYSDKKLILFFYPKDNTPGCTKEACNLRDNYELLLDKGFSIIGVSADDEQRHKKFIDKFNLPFPLIADVDKEIITAFGCWGLKKFMGKEYDGIFRKTFIIDKGIIVKVFEKVKTNDHTNQILNEL